MKVIIVEVYESMKTGEKSYCVICEDDTKEIYNKDTVPDCIIKWINCHKCIKLTRNNFVNCYTYIAD